MIKKRGLNKKLIVSFIFGILLIGSFLVVYNQKPENVLISEFLSNKLGGITGFAIILADSSGDWNALELVESDENKLNGGTFINIHYY